MFWSKDLLPSASRGNAWHLSKAGGGGAPTEVPASGGGGGTLQCRGENKGAESPGRNLCAGDGSEHGEQGEGEKRGKMRFRNIEERFLEPNSLKKKKNPRSGWQPRSIFIFGFSSRLYKLAWSVPGRVYNFVQFESDSLVSWMPHDMAGWGGFSIHSAEAR